MQQSRKSIMYYVVFHYFLKYKKSQNIEHKKSNLKKIHYISKDTFQLLSNAFVWALVSLLL